MAKTYRFRFSGDELSDEDREKQDRQTRSLAGMAVTLVVVPRPVLWTQGWG